MNIIARPYGSEMCYCRPDTTWQKEDRDFYSPNGIESISWAPVLFARISKAGKCVSAKFASRYYDALNFGALLYCHLRHPEERNLFRHPEKRSDVRISCVDHSSILPFPLYNPVVMENEENEFVVKKNGETLFCCKASGVKAIEDAICQASQFTSLRIGDMIAVELTPLQPLATRDEGTSELNAVFCENDIFRFKIIF